MPSDNVTEALVRTSFASEEGEITEEMVEVLIALWEYRGAQIEALEQS